MGEDGGGRVLWGGAIGPHPIGASVVGQDAVPRPPDVPSGRPESSVANRGWQREAQTSPSSGVPPFEGVRETVFPASAVVPIASSVG